MSKTQIGVSLTADFQEDTWTFEMGKDFKVAAGHFAIIPLDEFNKGTPVAKLQSQASLNFIDWLMENCELANDNSLWSYEGEDYTNERLYEIFESI